ncbi:SufE family protein [Melioribacteraceae bacterium 4301-Me]|uniref:SufE family protein n=1 Tax=Pyranulibacter aquaticus TaxID=3163344 RepID=UPI00359A4A05
MKNNLEIMIPKKLQELISFLNSLPDQQDRISTLIEYSEKYKPVPKEIATEPYNLENKVEYCESGAYVWTVKKDDNKFNFYFYVENPQGVSAKALCGIFSECLNGEPAENIFDVENDIIFKIFGQSLSMGKNLGLIGILQMIKSQVKNLLNSDGKK